MHTNIQGIGKEQAENKLQDFQQRSDSQTRRNEKHSKLSIGPAPASKQFKRPELNMDIGFLIENEKHRNNRGIISSFSPVNNEIKHFLAKRQSAHLQYEDIPVDTEK